MYKLLIKIPREKSRNTYRKEYYTHDFKECSEIRAALQEWNNANPEKKITIVEAHPIASYSAGAILEDIQFEFRRGVEK